MRNPALPLAASVALAIAACAPGPRASGEPAVATPTPRTAGTAARTAAPGEPRRAFKGYELYSWQDSQEKWRYALLLGTNRLKSPEEVLAAGVSEAELRLRLAELPATESVSWCRQADVETDPPLALPPPPVVDALVALAREREVRLEPCRD